MPSPITSEPSVSLGVEVRMEPDSLSEGTQPNPSYVRMPCLPISGALDTSSRQAGSRAFKRSRIESPGRQSAGILINRASRDEHHFLNAPTMCFVLEEKGTHQSEVSLSRK